MKARLLLGKMPSGLGEDEGAPAEDAPRVRGGGIDADALEALDTLNTELDIEMSALMNQLGIVKGEVIAPPTPAHLPKSPSLHRVSAG